ncbi:unnamed protein product, partial [Notodromas monacha]
MNIRQKSVLFWNTIDGISDFFKVSVGVLTYVLLTGCSPFGGETDQETLLNITQAQLDFPEELFAHISKDAQDFIKSLLKKSPSQRPTAKECLHHPWLTRRSYRRRKNLYKLAAKPPSMPALPFYKPPSKPPSLPSLLRSSHFFMPSMTLSTPSLVTPVMTISTPCLLMSPLGPLSPVNSFRVDSSCHRLDDPAVAFQQTLAAIARSNSGSSTTVHRVLPASVVSVNEEVSKQHQDVGSEDAGALSQSSDLPLSQPRSCIEHQDNYVSQDSAIEEDRSDLDDADEEKSVQSQASTDTTTAITTNNINNNNNNNNNINNNNTITNNNIEKKTVTIAQEELAVRSASFEKLLSGFMQRLGQQQNFDETAKPCKIILDK